MSAYSKFAAYPLYIKSYFVSVLMIVRCIQLQTKHCYHLKILATTIIIGNHPNIKIGAKIIPCIKFLRANFSFSCCLFRSYSICLNDEYISISLSNSYRSTSACCGTGSGNSYILPTILLQYYTCWTSSIC